MSHVHHFALLDLVDKLLGYKKMTKEEILHRKIRIYTIMRSQIVLVGGREFSNEQLGKMTLDEFWEIVIPNGISYAPKFSDDCLASMKIQL